MLDFICMGAAELFGTGREPKIQSENLCLQRDSNPYYDALMRKRGLISYRIVGNK